jgi:hypothetical protein
MIVDGAAAACGTAGDSEAMRGVVDFGGTVCGVSESPEPHEGWQAEPRPPGAENLDGRPVRAEEPQGARSPRGPPRQAGRPLWW